MSAADRVGEYRLLRVIGEGGMGVVHLGLDRAERAVAVKVVRPHVAADPQTRARLAREVRSLVKVRHPRVAEVLDADFDAELPYVVMRYVPGEALDAVVRRDGPLRGPQLDELMVGLFEAVSAIHSVGVVHRDLKPGNVLMLDGSPVVIDFGIARALDDVSLTSTGLMIGTPGYLSPEVLDGTDVGTAADWWGWGAVVAFAATGRPPFRSGPMEAVWDRVRRGAVDLAGLDDDLARLLVGALRPDPSSRPAPGRLADGIASLAGRRPLLTAPRAAAGAATTREAPRPAAASRPGQAPRTAVETRPDQHHQGPRRQDERRQDPRRQDETRQDRVLREQPAQPATRVIDRPTPVQPVRATGPSNRSGPPASPHVQAAAQATAPLRTLPSDRVGAAPPVPVGPPAAAAALGTVPAGPGPSDGRAVAQPSRHYGVGNPPVPFLPRRHLLALLGLVVLLAAAAVTPAGASLLGLLWVAVARATQWSRVAAARARWRTGRLGAGARTGLTLVYPVRVVGAVLASAGYLLLGTLVVSPLLLVGAAVLLRDVQWDSWTVARAVLTEPPVLAAAVGVGGLLAWFGPGGSAVRQGSRALTEPVARTRNGRLVLVGLSALVVVAAVLVVTAVV